VTARGFAKKTLGSAFFYKKRKESRVTIVPVDDIGRPSLS